MKAIYLIGASAIAFAFYGLQSPDTNRPGDLVSKQIEAINTPGESWHEKDATFSERFGIWAYDGNGFQPLESVAQCTTDSDCEEKFGADE